ncbi:CRISPR-associated protein Csx15 [Candidatus Chloroploca sp. Khr17]|uniref:CRISPR-associated protein Csx15 n=1 Tax=Candidatus Chloroploca sp. Khr17 TaxID=2496869 RepID=UPI001F11384B|nr:CRISPR-associated protein Csx15 [Candidatus Chloroploca sp. Khr17]
MILVLNYSHPLTQEQRTQIAECCGVSTLEVRDLLAQIDRARPLADIAQELANAADLTPEAWQTTPIILNPPALAPVALALVAELHGRCGGFPTMLNIRPVAQSVPTRYEVAEIVNLQTLRDAARGRRI